MSVTQKEYVEFYNVIKKLSGLDKKRPIEGMAFAGGSLVEHVALTSFELSLEEFEYGTFIDLNFKNKFIEAKDNNDSQTIDNMQKEIADIIIGFEKEKSTPHPLTISPSDNIFDDLIIIDDTTRY